MKSIRFLILTISLFGLFSFHLHRDARLFSSSTSVAPLFLPPSPSPPPPPPPPPKLLTPFPFSSTSLSTTTALHSQLSSPPSRPISTVSVLIPDWQVLVVVSPDTPVDNYTCIFPNKASSPASFAGKLPFSKRNVFTCDFPEGSRRKLPFLQPRLVNQKEESESAQPNVPIVELLKWNFLAYEAFTTEHDVVLLVKGVNTRQGFDRSPSDFRCVFGDHPLTAVRTPVTSSAQEVFRCARPQVSTASDHPIGATLEILDINGGANLVPSVARYEPRERRTVDFSEPPSLTCACTMVYNVRKFLREWVTYHAAVGIGKFILYDNDSDDELAAAVGELNRAGFDVRTVYWPWPKTQEAGFSHCTLYSEQICKWVAFLDVDEFILSAAWINASSPKPNMVQTSLLPKGTTASRVGQVLLKCYEFGPSNRTANPLEGVTQGYTCRRRSYHRHKSIVLLEALHPSLLNVVHHFELRRRYRSGQIAVRRAVVNHYKYQAWPEFQAKFRRRVSAFVLDWQTGLNPKSGDRAPGLGSKPVEPRGWAKRFCDVRDERLRVLTRKWFRRNSSTMAWQSALF